MSSKVSTSRFNVLGRERRINELTPHPKPESIFNFIAADHTRVDRPAGGIDVAADMQALAPLAVS